MNAVPVADDGLVAAVRREAVSGLFVVDEDAEDDGITSEPGLVWGKLDQEWCELGVAREAGESELTVLVAGAGAGALVAAGSRGAAHGSPPRLLLLLLLLLLL